MGQKINPVGFRLIYTKNWQSKWFDNRNFATLVAQDIRIRKLISLKLGFRASVAKVEIERSNNELTITVHTAKPGVVIGRSGAGIDALKKDLAKLIDGSFKINIEEVKNPELNAQLVAENVASQLERRLPFRRIIKSTTEASVRSGALGAKVSVSGRLNGAEMARRETSAVGSIPLHTIKADIDYAAAEAKTTFGVIGVKVWIYKG
ncbi:MAG: 30S ribosomal protein S3 [Patescibacteria group bacterium]|jgi:small subunit ribosomal protein S3|nr:30S ribosomal protein S3 [Patescibacteria group bacterium]